MSDFTAIFKEIEAINHALHGYLQRADVRLWTRVHFPGERYNLMTMNIAVQRIDDHHTEVKYGSSGESLYVVNLVE